MTPIAPVNAGAGNDRITSGAGTDLIEAGEGNDIIESGGGGDMIRSWNTEGTASDKNITEGGSGGDIIWGGLEEDRIFAENYGDMFMLISAEAVCAF